MFVQEELLKQLSRSAWRLFQSEISELALLMSRELIWHMCVGRCGRTMIDDDAESKL